MFIQLSRTFLGTRKQGWEFWRNRLPALCVARWTTKQALSETVWLVCSPGRTPTSSGAWKEWGRIAGKGYILYKLRNVCGSFFCLHKIFYKPANRFTFWQFCHWQFSQSGICTYPLALVSETFCFVQEWWVNTFKPVSLFCLSSIYQLL